MQKENRHHLNRFLETLQLLAAPYEQQVASFPAFVHIPDEIALLFDDAWMVYADELAEEGLITLDQRKALEHMNETLDHMSQIKDVWTLSSLEASSLKQLANEYQLRAGLPEKALQTYQQALPIVDQLTPLLQGRTYLGLALASAQCQQQNDAERYLGRAYESFPDKPEKDPSFASADCSLASLYLFKGLTYLSSNQPQKALDVFGEAENLQAKIGVPQRTFLHMKNCQAEAAIASKEKEQAQACLEVGVTGALELESKRSFRGSLSAYYKALKRWPNDKGLIGLQGLYQQGKGL